jgi:hypothetical protein
MAYKANKAKVDKEQDDFQTQMDADTLSRHAEITSDPERHQAAVDHLGKKAKTATTDHKTARKAFEKKTKGRLRKTFGGGNKGETFEQEKDKDTAQDEAIVNTKE